MFIAKIFEIFQRNSVPSKTLFSEIILGKMCHQFGWIHGAFKNQTVQEHFLPYSIDFEFERYL